MKGITGHEARSRRTRHPVALSLALGCYVLAAIAGMVFLTGSFGLLTLIPAGVVHGVLLIVPLRKLGAGEFSKGATLFIVATSLMGVFFAGDARDLFMLQQRGERVTAKVVDKRYVPGQGGRKPGTYDYELQHQDGTAVAGPVLNTSKDYGVGDVLTVIEDPEGKLRPRMPHQMGQTSDAISAGWFALAAVGGVGWTAWQGSDTARLRARRKEATGMRRLTRP